MTTNRVAEGVPTGGQFAASAKSESDIALAEPRTFSGTEIEAATDSYVAALTQYTYTESDEEGVYVTADEFEMSDAGRETCRGDVKDFLESNAHLIEKAQALRPGYTISQAMEDFVLTRSGHGAGFWDRGLGDVGDELTAIAKPYGSVDLYRDDNDDLIVS